MKITFIIAALSKSLGMEWMAKGLKQQGFEMEFVLLNDHETPFELFLDQQAIKVKRIYFKNPRQLPMIALQLFVHLIRSRPNIVHTHLPAANLAGLPAAWLAGIKKRVVTRHHGTFHHQYFPKAVRQDRLINFMATHIIAPSKNVQRILVEREKVAPEKVVTVHHGFSLEYFADAVKGQSLQEKYLPQHIQPYPIIGVVSRYLELKGIHYIIKAFKSLLKNHPQAFLLLANAKGPYEAALRKELGKLPKDSYIEIPFEENMRALYHLMDIYVHVPIDPEIEAFGQTYVEALASGVPSVFTLSGVAPEFIEHERNALVVSYQDSESIYQAVKRYLENPDLAKKLAAQGQKDVQKFNLEQMISNLSKLYLQ